MNPLVSALMFASGSVLASRLCHLSRLTGAALIASGLVLTASPALADETILVADNGEVRCQASKSDLTRISLKDDQFVSVSRVQSGIESEDFSIVHEPTRGDIYISVPQGYAKPNISFFGTTQNGFVYKFDCQVAVEAAVQVFVANADIDGSPPAPDWIAGIKKAAAYQNVYCKVSGLYQHSAVQPAPKDVEHYRSLLDTLWNVFGQDRLIYGSNWPVTKRNGDYASYVAVVNSYFAEKGKEASEHYFWKNAAEAYQLDLE